MSEREGDEESAGYDDSGDVLPPCPDCATPAGSAHLQGCDVERCRLCGGQAIGCYCVYELNELRDADREVIREPNDSDWEKFDKRVVELGGPLPWTGEWPGKDDCRRLNLWCKWTDDGWRECPSTDPDAREDLNELNAMRFKWDAMAGRWEEYK